MNRKMLCVITAWSAIAIALTTTTASAALVQLNATDTGAYKGNGVHDPANQVYITGLSAGENRSFFVFDLTSVSAPITAATLNLFNPNTNPHPCCQGYRSADATETFNLFDVTTPLGTLAAGGAGLTDVFADLGTGSLFGTYVAGAADNGKTISIALNATGLAALNGALGQIIAFGGALGTIAGTGDQYLFGFATTSFAGGDVRRLDLTTADVSQVPEPASLTLLGLGLATLGTRGWRRRRR